MKSLNITEEELISMSYDDVAYKILENNKKQMKIQDLFKEVIRVMKLNDSVFEEHLADFFELLSTDKRFIMIDKGLWDLKINHKTKLIIDDDDDDEIVDTQEDEETNDSEVEEDEEINYDEEVIDDDETEDDLKELVIMDENDESEIA